MKKTSSKMILYVNIAIIALLLTLNYFYQIYNFDYTLKCVCSSLFTLLGIINLCYALKTKQADKRFYIILTIAIVFSFFGDIFIYHSLIAGVVAFAISHIFFTTAYFFIQKIKILDLIIAALFFIPTATFLLFSPILTFEEAILQPASVIYAFIISIMTGKALGNFLRDKNSLNAILAIASFFFLISDFMLVFHFFSNIYPWAENACMALYYPSLCMFAFSMYFMQHKIDC